MIQTEISDVAINKFNLERLLTYYFTNLPTNRHNYTIVRLELFNMTWDGIVTKAHKYYLKELGIPLNIEAYM